ncbi:hypothetical protein DFH09DRAFT_1190669 [Mycena vulgaris]|nr:hypothetical protein DFH09DRAFT_1190669 [Mycena vulgaris]
MQPIRSSLVASYLLWLVSDWLMPLAAAAPSGISAPSRSVLPQDASRLAYNNNTHEIIAFASNGSNLGRFYLAQGQGKRAATGSCVDMSPADVQNMPGWSILQSTAQQYWGSGSYNLVTNDPHYPDAPAQVCAEMDTVPITTDGDPSCVTQNSTSGGEQVATDGSITQQHQSGITYTTTITVTQQSAFAAGAEVSVTLGLLNILGISAGVSFTSTFTNTLSTATTATSDQSSTVSVTQNTVANNTCYLEFITQICTITGSGQIRMLGTGWVWFEYKDRIDGHYYWALNMDAYLSNQDDRSSFTHFKAATGSNSASEFHGVCIPDTAQCTDVEPGDSCVVTPSDTPAFTVNAPITASNVADISTTVATSTVSRSPQAVSSTASTTSPTTSPTTRPTTSAPASDDTSAGMTVMQKGAALRAAMTVVWALLRLAEAS